MYENKHIKLAISHHFRVQFTNGRVTQCGFCKYIENPMVTTKLCCTLQLC